jgi:cytoskeletal protein CcmA (bactofilin family)
MQKNPNPHPECSDAPASRDASFVDTEASFAAWLDVVKPAAQTNGDGCQLSRRDEHTADFFVECAAGSDCQIVFTGVLDLDGSLSGSLRSDNGTLITHPGRINGDIDVAGRAFIDSIVNGNINATGRVVLNSNAMVTGNISARALSVKRGAIFEGDCAFVGGQDDEVQATDDPPEAIGFYTASAIGD